MRGIVFDGSDLVVVDDLEVRPPGPGEVTVRVLASGICHSDLNVVDGTSPVPAPLVLGHEGAGVIVETGQPVLLGGLSPCGTCRPCRTGHPTACPTAFGTGATPFRWRGQAVRSYANVSSFASEVTVPASRCIPIDGLDPQVACVLGCAVSTGWGVVTNVAAVQPGDRVAVVGIGGIGSAALQTARLQGASEIVAIDRDPGKEAAALRFGATRFATELEGEHDAVIECSGAPSAIEAAIEHTAPGGTVALVGIPASGHRATFDVGALLRGRRIVGSLNGDVVPERDLPRIVDAARRGDLDVAGLVSRVWPMAEVHDAVAAVRNGEVVRAVLDLR